MSEKSVRPVSAVPLTPDLAEQILANGTIHVSTSQGTVVLAVKDLFALVSGHRPPLDDNIQQKPPHRRTGFSATVGAPTLQTPA